MGIIFSSKQENSALSMKIPQNALFRSCAARFSPNRAFDRQSSQNRGTVLKFSSKRKNSALSMKIVQNALFSSCAARFGQIAVLTVKVLKILTLAWNSRQNGKTVRFPWKLYKTLFSAHAQHVLAKSRFWAWKFSKSSHWPEILAKTGKQCAFHQNCTKRSFQDMRSTFWPNRSFDRQSSQNPHIGIIFSSKQENSALSIKIVQNVLFRSCAARFSLSIKIVQNPLFRTCGARFGQIAFFHRQSSQNRHTGLKFSSKRKNCAFHENCTKRFFQLMRSTFWLNHIFKRASSQNPHTGLKFSPNGKTVRFPLKLC